MKRLLFSIVVPGLAAAELAQGYKNMGPDIFDPRAAGEDLIAAALTRAAEHGQRVLVLFGANWCPWTRRLDHLLKTDRRIGEVLQHSYVLVYVDANTRKDKQRNATAIARYGNPVRFGIPVFVVLDHDGRQLTTRETQSLAAPTDDEVAVRLRQFLREWAPGAAGAEARCRAP
jgi:thioredoxin 1